jgi:hypothetical protein
MRSIKLNHVTHCAAPRTIYTAGTSLKKPEKTVLTNRATSVLQFQFVARLAGRCGVVICAVLVTAR